MDIERLFRFGEVPAVRRLPLGIDNFRELIEDEYYFVDKTYFIKDLLDTRAKVTLLTRPRRFGKTLTLSMLKEFFDVNSADSRLFDELSISIYQSSLYSHSA